MKNYSLSLKGKKISEFNTFNPYPEIPPNMLEPRNIRPRVNYRCKHKGKVFNIGMFKTGTKSVSLALEMLGLLKLLSYSILISFFFFFTTNKYVL